jgi:hypothetical protein
MISDANPSPSLPASFRRIAAGGDRRRISRREAHAGKVGFVCCAAMLTLPARNGDAR